MTPALGVIALVVLTFLMWGGAMVGNLLLALAPMPLILIGCILGSRRGDVDA